MHRLITTGSWGVAAAVAVGLCSPAAALAQSVPVAKAPTTARTPSTTSTSLTSEVVPGQWIVRLKDRASAASVTAHARRFGATSVHVWTQVMTGYSAKLSSSEVADLRADSSVASVTPVHRLHVTSDVTQSGVDWGLDRIDHHKLVNADGAYTYRSEATGAGVTAYVIDSGLNTTHIDFTGRVGTGKNFVAATYTDENGDTQTDEDGGDPAVVTDCLGHGTHVSGSIGGTTYGVAKDVTIVPVRVFACDGTAYDSWIYSAMNWVIAQHKASATKLDVVNMSLGGAKDATFDAAVKKMITAGISTVVAAGNETVNACTESPSDIKSAIVVGASGDDDAAAYFSNYGSCVDLYAPGVDVTSDYIGSDTATISMDGTSMASPHVAGVVAQLRQAHPTDTPAQIETRLVNTTAKGVLSNLVPGTSDPNLLLQLEDVTAPTGTSVTAAVTCRQAKVTLHGTDADSGLGRAATVWNHTAADTTVGTTSNATGATFTKNLAKGTWYLHARVGDRAGNLATDVVTSAAVKIVKDCPKVTKVAVSKLSGKRLKTTATVTDPGGKFTKYQFVLNHSKTSAKGTKHATTTRTYTKKVASGSWYVHVRARNDLGHWTSWKVSVKKKV